MISVFKKPQIRRLALSAGATRVGTIVYDYLNYILDKLIDVLAHKALTVTFTLRMKTIEKPTLLFILAINGLPVAYDGTIELFNQSCDVEHVEKLQSLNYKICHVFDRAPIIRLFREKLSTYGGDDVRISESAKELIHFAVESYATKLLQHAVDYANTSNTVTLTAQHVSTAYNQLENTDNYPTQVVKSYSTFINKLRKDLNINAQASASYIDYLNNMANHFINRVAMIAVSCNAFFPNKSRYQRLQVAIYSSIPVDMRNELDNVVAKTMQEFEGSNKVPQLLIPMNRLNEHFVTFSKWGLGRDGYILLESAVALMLAIMMTLSVNEMGNRKRLAVEHLQKVYDTYFRDFYNMRST